MKIFNDIFIINHIDENNLNHLHNLFIVAILNLI